MSDQQRDLRITGHLNQRSACQSTNRIECDVAQNFHPNLVSDASRNPAAEAGSDQRFRNSTAALRTRAVRLAQGDSIALGELDNSRFDNFSGKIDD